MKRTIAVFAFVCCLLGISACGTLPEVFSSAGLNSVSVVPDLVTTSVTVYDTWTGESWEVTDDALIERLRKVTDVSDWEALIGLGNQISAVPNYAIDLNNGTCFGLLGDGYVLIGTGYEFVSEENFRIIDGVQYQVPVEFTDLLNEIIACA